MFPGGVERLAVPEGQLMVYPCQIINSPNLSPTMRASPLGFALPSNFLSKARGEYSCWQCKQAYRHYGYHSAKALPQWCNGIYITLADGGQGGRAQPLTYPTTATYLPEINISPLETKSSRSGSAMYLAMSSSKSLCSTGYPHCSAASIRDSATT